MNRANWADHLAGQLTTGGPEKAERVEIAIVFKLLQRKPSTFFHVAEVHFRLDHMGGSYLYS